MPSKGFQLYTYITLPNTQVKYCVPGAVLTRSEPRKFFNDHLEVDKANLKDSVFNYVGRFQFDVLSGDKTILTQWCDVNTITGNIVRGSDLREMEDQVSHVTETAIVTYGLYDSAGTGAAGLPKSNQVWVTVHENRTKWIGDLAPEGSLLASKPFSRFVLPSAHDVGMNNMQNVDAIFRKSGQPFITCLRSVSEAAKVLSAIMSESALVSFGPNVIRGLAFNQKDSLLNMLAIGSRYFEFRPAHLHKAIVSGAPIQDRLYFHHGPIPGMSFEQFLHDCVQFLTANETEIIVVQLRWDGVPAECARPGDVELADYIGDAIQPTNGSIVVGSLDDMQRLTTDQLRKQRKRLIIFKTANQFSTWNEKANATLDGNSIVAEFDKLASAQQTGRAFTLLQCQATATNLKDVVAYSVITANVSNSCLLATKAVCDHKTLPWVRDRALKALTAEQLLVLMNDFIDGATVDTAIEMSRKRLARD